MVRQSELEQPAGCVETSPAGGRLGTPGPGACRPPAGPAAARQHRPRHGAGHPAHGHAARRIGPDCRGPARHAPHAPAKLTRLRNFAPPSGIIQTYAPPLVHCPGLAAGPSWPAGRRHGHGGCARHVGPGAGCRICASVGSGVCTPPPRAGNCVGNRAGSRAGNHAIAGQPRAASRGARRRSRPGSRITRRAQRRLRPPGRRPCGRQLRRT